MDNQVIMPDSSGPFNTMSGGLPGPSRRSSAPIGPILLVILALGTLVFGILTIVFYNQASHATQTLNDQKAAAAATARKDQKQIDDDVNAKANELPFRSYVAPQEFGSFVINFPKDWSAYLVQQQNGNQVTLTMNPFFVRHINGIDELSALRVTLREQTSDQYLGQYTSYVKNGSLKITNTTVSGQPAYDVTGKFSDRRTVHEVVVPIRDKVLTFATEDAKYSAEFGQVLAQAKIIP